jgi:hypothetical protein
MRGELGEWVLGELERLDGPFAWTEQQVVRSLMRVMSEEEARQEVKEWLEEIC